MWSPELEEGSDRLSILPAQELKAHPSWPRCKFPDCLGYISTCISTFTSMPSLPSCTSPSPSYLLQWDLRTVEWEEERPGTVWTLFLREPSRSPSGHRWVRTNRDVNTATQIWRTNTVLCLWSNKNMGSRTKKDLLFQKRGRWGSLHVCIAWKIYYHEQLKVRHVMKN